MQIDQNEKPEALKKLVRETCQKLVGADPVKFPCKWPECTCGDNDLAVVEGKAAFGSQWARRS